MQQEFYDRSMLPILPSLAKCPMNIVHQCVDVYRIFRVEPLIVLSLAISRVLKECLTRMLRDESWVMLAKYAQPRSFTQIW